MTEHGVARQRPRTLPGAVAGDGADAPDRQIGWKLPQRITDDGMHFSKMPSLAHVARRCLIRVASKVDQRRQRPRKATGSRRPQEPLEIATVR